MRTSMTSAAPELGDEPATGPHPTPTEHTRSPAPYLAPVPDSLPPYDDERSALSRLRLLAEQQRAAEFRALNRSTAPRTISNSDVPSWSKEADMGVRKTGSGALPPALRTGQALARALVEMLSGRRPMAQLRVHCAPDVFAGLERKMLQASGTSQLTSVRVCEPADGVAEVSAVFRTGGRARALAFRIQGLDGRWRVTALQTG